MKNLNLIFLSLVVVLLQSCATRSLDVDFDLPGAQYMMSPETNGARWAFELGGRVHIAHDIELASSSQSESLFSSSPGDIVISTSSVMHGGGLAIGFDGSVGLHERIDLFLATNSQSVVEFGGKFCILGNPNHETEGWKVSIFGAIGFSEEDETSKDSFFSVDDDEKEYDNVEANLDQDSISVGTVFGYRFDEKLLTYINMGYRKHDLESTIEVNKSEFHNLGGRTESYNALAGLRFDGAKFGKNKRRNTFINVEAGYGKVKLWGADREKRWKDGLIGAVGLGLHFE